MIVYQNKLGNFINDVSLNQITEIIENTFREKHISGGSTSEVNSWQNSLHFMKDVVDCPLIPKDCDVAIEYTIPQTSKRVDFMLLGKDKTNDDHIIIVELKQWSHVEKVDDISKHSVRADLHGKPITVHPSYQAFSYKSLILNYCDTVDLLPENLNPCAYLHNMSEAYRQVLEDEFYSDWTNEAPVFLRSDVIKLRDFISSFITAKSDSGDLLYKIDFGRIKPSKALQDSIDSMLCGNEEFKMIDEQAVAYDFIMKAIESTEINKSNGIKLKKKVLVIEGGPGTGKSVLAVNVLADSIRKLGLNAAYITKNSAPRKCFAEILSKGNSKKQVDLDLAFRSPHKLPSIPMNGLDVGIFDEAHRMQKKPFMYKGDDLLRDAIRASVISVFFIDNDQRITTKDCYSSDQIYKYAKEEGAEVVTETPLILESQFRCNGSNGYIAFLDDLLGLRETANKSLDIDGFDFRVFDTPKEVKDALVNAPCDKNKARMTAGYCYDWNVKNKRGDWDIIIDDFKAKWNNPNRSELFSIDPNALDEIGCIHTVQGMEFDYIGVIIGKDLIYKGGKVSTDQNAISKDDNSSGIRTCKDKVLADRLIRNTYKVLLTRGQKGCYVFCEDEALKNYIKYRIGQ